MIDWTDKAIEAAIDAFYEGSDMRRALDAAVKAQKQSGIHDVTDYMNGLADGYEKGRAEALEEAARAAEVCHFDEDDPRNDDRDRAYAQARRHAAQDIRALKEKQG